MLQLDKFKRLSSVHLLRQLGQIHGGKEIVAHLEHLERRIALLHHLGCDIHKGLVRERRDQVCYVRPLLCPHIAQQMHWQRSLLGHDCIPVVFPQAIAHIAMDLFIERTNFLKDILQLLLKRFVLVLIQPDLSARSKVY